MHLDWNYLELLPLVTAAVATLPSSHILSTPFPTRVSSSIGKTCCYSLILWITRIHHFPYVVRNCLTGRTRLERHYRPPARFLTRFILRFTPRLLPPSPLPRIRPATGRLNAIYFLLGERRTEPRLPFRLPVLKTRDLKAMSTGFVVAVGLRTVDTVNIVANSLGVNGLHLVIIIEASTICVWHLTAPKGTDHHGFVIRCRSGVFSHTTRMAVSSLRKQAADHARSLP